MCAKETVFMEATVLYAFLVGLASAVSLPLGTLTTLFWRLSNKSLSLLIAFGAGALLAALTIDLVVPSLEAKEFPMMAVGCIFGSLLYLGLNSLINNRGGFLRKTSTTLSYFNRHRERKFARLAQSFKRIPFLQELPESEIRHLAAITKLKEYPAGALLYQKGDTPPKLYIVDEGAVQLLDPRHNMEPFLRLGPGASFSRMAFITGLPNATAARTDGQCSVWIIDQEEFFTLLKTAPHLKENLAEFLSSSEEVKNYLIERQDMEKSDADLLIQKAIVSVRHSRPLCSTMPHDSVRLNRALSALQKGCRFPVLENLPHDIAEDVALHLELRHYSKKEVIYRFSEYADRLYLIDKGNVTMIDQTDKTNEPLHLGPGCIFGALSMLTGAHHAVAAMAVDDVDLWILKRQDFDALIRRHKELETRLSAFLISGKAKEYLELRQNFNPDIATQWTQKALGLLGNANRCLPTAEEMNAQLREHKNAPLAIWLGIFLDGIPESLVIGAMMTKTPMISLSLLAGLFLSNYPEALSSSAGMRQQGMSFRNVFLIWSSLTLMTGIGAAIGNMLFQEASPHLFSLTEGIAAGAMLTVTAETMLPEAYLKGGSITGLTTLLGFLCALLFKQIGN
jgi:CRP-like cAMP-binding protein